MSDNKYDYGLLQYSGSDDHKIVANSVLEDTKPTLIQYLIRNNIPIVQEIPERWGVFCIQDEKVGQYRVYTVYFDKESGIYLKEYQYSLQWINIIAKTLESQKEEDKVER